MQHWPPDPSQPQQGGAKLYGDDSLTPDQDVWELRPLPTDLGIDPAGLDDLPTARDEFNPDLDFELPGGADAARPARKRPYKPRTGTSREKNIETQRRYRQRQKEKAAASVAAVAAAAAELETLRAEQVALMEQNRALELLRQCSEGAISLLRSASAAAGSLASSAASSVLSFFGDVFGLLWAKGIKPTDSQLRFIARHIDCIPPAFTGKFVTRIVSALEQWHNSPPAGRQAIEQRLAAVFEARFRIMAIVYSEFPEKAHYVMRTSAEVGSLRQKIDQLEVLRAPDVLEAVAMTDEQTATMRYHWEAYSSKYCDAKSLVGDAASRTHVASEPFVSEVNSMRGLARRNNDAQHGLVAAESFLAEERAARVELIRAAQDTLKPIQLAWYQLMAVRMLPFPEIVPVVKFIVLNTEGPSALKPEELLAAMSLTEQGGGGPAVVIKEEEF